ncbi:14641_t:CDS:2, partial [Funneliformis mosseae]
FLRILMIRHDFEEQFEVKEEEEDHIAVEKKCVIAEKNYIATEKEKEQVIEKELIAIEEEPAITIILQKLI